jgi:hypothetical protein
MFPDGTRHSSREKHPELTGGGVQRGGRSAQGNEMPAPLDSHSLYFVCTANPLDWEAPLRHLMLKQNLDR